MLVHKTDVEPDQPPAGGLPMLLDIELSTPVCRFPLRSLLRCQCEVTAPVSSSQGLEVAQEAGVAVLGLGHPGTASRL